MTERTTNHDASQYALNQWDFDDSSVWLTALDALCARSIAHHLASQWGSCHVLEIGVWKAAWSMQVASVSSLIDITGVDPYPNAQGVMDSTARRIQDRGLSQRLRIVADYESAKQLSTNGTWDLIHVDGLHTQEAARLDLEFAHSCLSEHGVIVMDDYRHLHFPGVAAAMYSFLERSDMAIFMVTEAKAYLSKAEKNGYWMDYVAQSLTQCDIAHWRYHGEGQTSRYVQPPDVFGFPLVIAYDPDSRGKLLDPISSPAQDKVFRQRFKSKISRWIPPAIVEKVRRHRSP